MSKRRKEYQVTQPFEHVARYKKGDTVTLTEDEARPLLKRYIRFNPGQKTIETARVEPPEIRGKKKRGRSNGKDINKDSEIDQ